MGLSVIFLCILLGLSIKGKYHKNHIQSVSHNDYKYLDFGS